MTVSSYILTCILFDVFPYELNYQLGNKDKKDILVLVSSNFPPLPWKHKSASSSAMNF